MLVVFVVRLENETHHHIRIAVAALELELITRRKIFTRRITLPSKGHVVYEFLNHGFFVKFGIIAAIIVKCDELPFAPAKAKQFGRHRLKWKPQAKRYFPSQFHLSCKDY